MGSKQQVLQALEELPDDALDRILLLVKVERGLRQADEGHLMSQEDVRQRMARWLK